jgi:hypothetical protein
MNKSEIKSLLMIAIANFPSMQERNMTPTAELWSEVLSDIDYQVAKSALIKVLSTSEFFPTVAKIREAVAMITQPNSLDAMEAWGLIGQAVRRYGFNRKAEAMAMLPAEVVEMVERFSWREICYNENPDTLRAQFRMAWETQSKRKKELMALPADIRRLIEGSSVKYMQIEDKPEQEDKK